MIEALYSTLTEFIHILKHTNYIFLIGPLIVKAVSSGEVSIEDIGETVIHVKIPYVIHNIFVVKIEVIAVLRKLFNYLLTANWKRNFLMSDKRCL